MTLTLRKMFVGTVVSAAIPLVLAGCMTAPPSPTSPPSTHSSTTTAPPAATIPGDGTVMVGADVSPGQYKTTGGEGCYWERLKGTSGSPDDIIANGLPSGPAVVTIMSTDRAFSSRSCAEWQKVRVR